MKKFPKTGILAFLFVSGISLPAFGAAPVKYSQVEFDLSLVSIAQLGALGLPVDHHDSNGEGVLSMPVSQYDLELLKAQNIPYTVLIDDAAQAVEQRNIAAAKAAAQAAAAMPPPLYFKHGSMGGYLTYAQIVAEIDEMRTRYPQYISSKFSIGTSIEGRTQWAVRVSNTPDVEQKPRKIVYNTLTHPREPMAMMSMMWFLWNMFQTYSTNAASRSCIDNVEIYYIPVVNPDGYEYNRATNPSGGGLWRKNRRPNAGGTMGVDLNRNYSVNWGNDAGSSATSSSDTYRGTAAFSEPETQNVRNFYLPKNFLISSNYHTYANKLLHPYGISGQPTNMAGPQGYTALCQAMTAVSGWQYGRVPPTIGYSAAGIEIDWAHDIARTLAVNPEQGTAADGGFWPAESSIDALALQAQDMNVAMCAFAQNIPVPVISRVQVTPNFSMDLSASRGEWTLSYVLTDAKRTWHVNVYDMQGKRYQRLTLDPEGKSVALSRRDLPRSLGLFEVSACKAGNCESVYKQKLVMGGF